MAFIDKVRQRKEKIDILSPDEQDELYTNTSRCPKCYIIPAFNLVLDLDTLLSVKVTCLCGVREIEINDFFKIYNEDFRGNIQCYSCKSFASKNNTIFKYCLSCKQLFCGECQYDHMLKKEHIFIPFSDIGVKCNYHNLYYKAFCKNCHIDICKACYIEHTGHKIVNYNSLYISDLEMSDYNTNYGKCQLNVYFRDMEIKENVYSILKDADELEKSYATELFDANKEKNMNILEFFKFLLTIYNNSAHKTYNIIMNVRNNLSFNILSFEIKQDSKIDENSLLNRFYVFSKNNCIAKKPKPFREKYEIINRKRNVIKSEMEDDYQDIIENIKSYVKIINSKKLLLRDNIDIRFQIPYKYQSYIYFGEYMVDKFIAHGRGIIIYKNGDRYYGNFENGKRNKIGIYYFKQNGAKYKGEWEENKMNGYGTFYYPNGTIYEGYFKNNKRHGAGLLTTSNGDIYKSIWNEGNVSDFGRILYKDGKYYEGFINNYKKEECGILNFPNGDVFKGEFKNNSFHFGIYKYKNGNSYYGFYKNNKMNGYGKYKYKDIGEVYEGFFVNDKREGIGRYIYRNGDIYSGELFDDLKQGFGILRYNNGDWYKGIFVKNIRQGIGIYYEEKGKEFYIGEWMGDKKEGIATVYNRNWLYKGTVKNGIREGYAFFNFGNNYYIYYGPFKDNLWVGYGFLKNNKGVELYKGYFKKGRMPISKRHNKEEEYKKA